jgi:hypothetical protein
MVSTPGEPITAPVAASMGGAAMRSPFALKSGVCSRGSVVAAGGGLGAFALLVLGAFVVPVFVVGGVALPRDEPVKASPLEVPD